MNARRVISVVLLILVAGTGCSRTIAGHPVPAATTPSSTTSASLIHPSEAKPAAPSVTPDPCGLLNAEEVTQLGLPQARTSRYANPSSCIWATPNASLGITVDSRHGLADLKTTKAVQVSSRTIGRHEVRVVEFDDHCDLDIPTSEHSSITVSAMIIFPGHATSRQACGRATQATALVEPRIPGT
jgi:Protein of unknown function (DUF3558)